MAGGIIYFILVLSLLLLMTVPLGGPLFHCWTRGTRALLSMHVFLFLFLSWIGWLRDLSLTPSMFLECEWD